MVRERVYIVADDLTGALDSAAGFAERGARVRVACRPKHLAEALASDAEVVAVATGTRDGTEAEAAEVARAVARDLEGHSGILFKKIDSRLKGHVAAELAALAPGAADLVVNPAIPKLGRHCLGGAVTGEGVDGPIPVARRIGRSVDIPDTRSQDDLAAQLPEVLSEAVYVGAAGLAEALADRLWPEAARCALPKPAMPALMAIGSRDPVTLAQVDALRGLPMMEAPNGACPDFPEVPLLLIRMTPGAEAIPGEAAAAAFAETLATAQARMRPATLFACGGESAAALLARLEIGQLHVLGQILPGVPVARSADAASLTLITKSGGFGAPDMLAKLVKILTKD